jgi:hypothetical protein
MRESECFSPGIDLCDDENADQFYEAAAGHLAK